MGIAQSISRWLDSTKTRCERLGHFWQQHPSMFYEETRDHPGGPVGNDMWCDTYETMTRTCRCCGLRDTLIVKIGTLPSAATVSIQDQGGVGE